MKTIEDAVIELDGKWPNGALDYIYSYLSASCFTSAINIHVIPEGKIVFSKEQFESCAKELGYINGYRWGLEYPTSGKRPELADDVMIQLTLNSFNINHENVETANWSGSFKFKIIDTRYKPADTSYLDVKQQDHIVEANEMVSDWWDYDKLQVKSGKLIPVGSEVLFLDRAPNPFKCKVMYSSEYVTVIRCINGSVNKEMIGVDISRCPFEENFNQIKPLDWNQKSEMEREKVIEAANKIYYASVDVDDFIENLVKAEMLVLPQDSSDTKD